jgi:bifunctional DNase/RNase
MIEVTIDSIRVSLMSQHRVVVLKDVDSERYLTIWIGTCEAESITVKLQEIATARPLTHDLLLAAIQQLGGEIIHVMVQSLQQDVFYAQVVVQQNGKQIELDARPSDALALAVRADVPIYIATDVMDQASSAPDEDLSGALGATENVPEQASETETAQLSAFADFMETLDLDDLPDETPED